MVVNVVQPQRLAVTRWPRAGLSRELASSVLRLYVNSWHETRLNCLQGPGPDVESAPCAGSWLISLAGKGMSRLTQLPPGVSQSLARPSARAEPAAGVARHGVAQHGAVWRGTAPLSTAQPLAVTVSLGRDTAGRSTRGCGWHQRDREHQGRRDGLSPSAGASRGSCPGTQHPAPTHHMLALSMNPAGFGRGGGARGLFQSDAQG